MECCRELVRGCSSGLRQCHRRCGRRWERAQIEAWLTQKPPLRLTRVHELLQRKGVAAGYTTLRRYVEREPGWQKREPTVRMADPPLGEEAQVDFGQAGMVTSSNGRRRKLWVLIVTLSCSRYQFIWPTFEQTTQEVCAGLDAAWRFFDGVVKRLVPITAAVAHRTALTPLRGLLFPKQQGSVQSALIAAAAWGVVSVVDAPRLLSGSALPPPRTVTHTLLDSRSQNVHLH